ncbi:hypothetical protein [Streptomyces sp. NPDC014006]|uniref:hypothetical protein n=1 Tax=Streptomyces sp. NPDC014006 TaxID=3364870 RepID=UPI0036FD2C72
MTVRDAVRDFLEVTPLPSESDASEEELDELQRRLEAINPPVSVDEAELLAGAFGSDDCYGLAWTLLHLIETAPGQPAIAEPTVETNEWVRRLWERRVG